jgi:phosphatidylserine decarboxylase
MQNSLAVLIQHLLPKQILTILAGKFANFQGGQLTTTVIDWFINRYQVNMAEAAESNASTYKTFNSFFTRPLKIGARPLALADFICPVDGAISQFGSIEKDQIFQAKGHHYSTAALLGGDEHLALAFENGHFTCLYLSPKDYHRIHMPCDGKLLRMVYIPGALFSVNPTTAQGVPGLFARNERVVCEFESEHGKFVMVLVGATIVGSMSTVWHGVVNPPRSRSIRTWSYENKDTSLKQGDEMGRFLLGSTVLMLFQKDSIIFNTSWSPTSPVKMGEVMGASKLVPK